MNAPLDIQAREFNRLRERLAADFGLDENDEAVIDTADGETNLTDLLVRMVRQARDRTAQADVCTEQMRALAERKGRHVAAADRLRSLVAEAMLETGIRKLSPGDFTATARLTAPKPEIVNEEDLLPFYTRIVRKPDMDAIRLEHQRCAAEGEAMNIPGVVISNGRPSLTLRT